jgi:asparagine synthase (glutamine-hydrolysing)
MLHTLHSGENQRRVVDRFGCYPVWYDFWQITAECMPGLFNADLEPELARDESMDALAAAMKPRLEGRHRVNQSLYIETKTRLPGWILRRSDRMSMAHGVEARVPFLDHPLVELAARMPPDLKLRGMNEKYLLKKISMPHLPQHPSNYKKKAFYTPIREWFFTPAQQEQLEPYLGTEALRSAGLFNPARVAELRQRIAAARAPADMNDYYRLMQLEWIMLLVLTVQIMHDQFVLRRGGCFRS